MNLDEALARFDGEFKGLSVSDRYRLAQVIEALRSASAPLSLKQIEAATSIPDFFLEPTLAVGIERKLIRQDDDGANSYP